MTTTTPTTATEQVRAENQPHGHQEMPPHGARGISSTQGATVATGKLWGIKDVSTYLDIPVQTLYQWRTKGYGPPGRRVGKYVRYVPTDVIAWFESLPAEVA